MDDNVKPSTIMLIVGGGVLFISTFLDWRSSGSFGVNGWEVDSWGLLGIVIALIGLDICVTAALRQFSTVNLPDEILSFTTNQLHLALGFMAFVVTFGQIFASNAGIGLHLGWIAAAAIVAAAVMDMREGAGDAAPTQF